MSTIFWYKALRLKGSTVKGRVPVSMAYMFTPLKRETPEHETRRRPRGEVDKEDVGLGKLQSCHFHVHLGAPPWSFSRTLSSALKQQM